MATLRPFRALRPTPETAAQIAAVPYDVVSTAEALKLADGNPLSFLRVSRAEIELPAATDPYAASVYERAAANFGDLKRKALVLEDEPLLYLYRLTLGHQSQTGLAACFSLDEYERNVIKKHEKTRQDKEDDRTRHMLALGAQTGPVFLTYRAVAEVDDISARVAAGPTLFDFEAVHPFDGVRHTIWRVAGADRDRLVAVFRTIPALYIADGHHRAASAFRASQQMPRDSGAGPLGDHAGADTVLAVAFPHDQVRILPYNRVVKDLGGLSADQFRAALQERFDVSAGPAVPRARGEIAMYFQGSWQILIPRRRPGDRMASDPIATLDVSILQNELLAPVLKIADVRTDKRIDFVGGIRGTGALSSLVDSGAAAVAFSLFPVDIADLMAVSDGGGIMPPKSTWFEPKLRDGLLIHMI